MLYTHLSVSLSLPKESADLCGLSYGHSRDARNIMVLEDPYFSVEGERCHDSDISLVDNSEKVQVHTGNMQCTFYF